MLNNCYFKEIASALYGIVQCCGTDSSAVTLYGQAFKDCETKPAPSPSTTLLAFLTISDFHSPSLSCFPTSFRLSSFPKPSLICHMAKTEENKKLKPPSLSNNNDC